MNKSINILLFAGITFSQAYVKRLAVIIGNNQGLGHERPLKYAERDASNLARVIQHLGSIEKDRLYLLVNSDVKIIQQTLNEVSGRIKELKKSKGKVMVMIYFSGHGSADALHVNGKKYPREKFLAKFESLGADLKLLIVDACESGDLLRSKGGQVIKNYVIEKEDRLQNKGTVILTSTSKGELAQESEDYRGAVFTHHFINGLKGLADYNNDKEITLWESFQYASVGTRSENVMGRVDQQTPNFDVDIVGKGDLVLTSLHQKRGQILLKDFPNVAVDIYNAVDMRLEAKLILSGRDSIYYILPQKKHLLTMEDKKSYKVAKVDLKRSQKITITPKSFRAYSRAEVNRKGGNVITLNPHALSIGEAYGVVGSGTAVPFTYVTYSYQTGYIRHNLLWGIGFSSETGSQNELIEKTINRFSYEVKKPVLRMGAGQLLLGANVGMYVLNQTLTDRRFEGSTGEFKGNENLVSKSTAAVYELGMPLEMEFFLFSGIVFSLQAQVSLQAYNDSKDELKLAPQYLPSLFLGYRF